MRDKVIVITGASGGIGAALADAVAKRGASVVLVARREGALSDAARACGERAHPVVGQGISRMPSQLTDQDVDDIIQVNVKSALYGMQEILPHFKERGEGHVINVSSMLGRIPFALIRSAYSGAKHFLNALTANFREEVQQTHPNIQFSLISPGVVSTDFGLNARHGGPDSRALPNAQTADEVAAVIAGVIETRRADVYTRSGARERIASYYASVGEDP
jgi:short-subunit dehydrogenase